MHKMIDEKKILRLNPHINQDKLKESILISRQLAGIGVKMADYNLASPFSHRKINKQKGKIRLHRNRW